MPTSQSKRRPTFHSVSLVCSVAATMSRMYSSHAFAIGEFVAYYGDLNYDHGRFALSIDNGPVTVTSSYSAGIQSIQALFSQVVDAGPHAVTITNMDDQKVLILDYFVYVYRRSAAGIIMRRATGIDPRAPGTPSCKTVTRSSKRRTGAVGDNLCYYCKRPTHAHSLVQSPGAVEHLCNSWRCVSLYIHARCLRVR